MLILTFEDSEEEILNHIISCVNTGARAFQVIENAKTNLSYGDIVILLDKRELFRKQEKIDLSFIEFEILHLLMRSPGRVFSKEQIYDIIWNEPYSGDYNVVMRHICNIREKIEDDPGHGNLTEMTGTALKYRKLRRICETPCWIHTPTFWKIRLPEMTVT